MEAVDNPIVVEPSKEAVEEEIVKAVDDLYGASFSDEFANITVRSSTGEFVRRLFYYSETVDGKFIVQMRENYYDLDGELAPISRTVTIVEVKDASVVQKFKQKLPEIKASQHLQEYPNLDLFDEAWEWQKWQDTLRNNLPEVHYSRLTRPIGTDKRKHYASLILSRRTQTEPVEVLSLISNIATQIDRRSLVSSVLYKDVQPMEKR